MQYCIKLKNTGIEALYDTGASFSVMSQRYFNKLKSRPKLVKCNRTISEAGGGTLPVGECFVQLQIGNKIFRDRIIFIEILTRDYILDQVLHRAIQFDTGHSTMEDITSP